VNRWPRYKHQSAIFREGGKIVARPSAEPGHACKPSAWVLPLCERPLAVREGRLF